MRRLIVENFSCIEEAVLDLHRFTVLIGPQASGKSVLSKLVYFFYQLLSDQIRLLDERQSLANFSEHVRTQFREWFPVSAWGPKKFFIQFESGEYQIRLTRHVRGTHVSDSFRIWYSPFFKQQYTSALQMFSEEGSIAESATLPLETTWRVRDTVVSNLRHNLGDENFPILIFVPAGRSFFTSIGKAVLTFEHARILDPVTLQFGRRFLALRDQDIGSSRRVRNRPRVLSLQTMQKLFGGIVKSDRDRDYVETSDGRRVPFSALSSGQQELLPLWLVIEYTGQGRGRRQLTFIEEPEAHLFPSAQSDLVEVLAGLVMSDRSRVDLLVTTHSPYVLAKLNNLIKAGQVASSADGQALAELERVLPRRSWVERGVLAAYAIQEKKLVPIMGQDGLIDADYLDDVSNDIAREFSELLRIEASHVAR